jgi:ABC-type polysaccharide/polyol phosphate transport system ATPase subunit
MVTIGLYNVTKRLRKYGTRNRWLRQDVLHYVLGSGGGTEWLTVLDGINLEIEQRERVGILGTNGSGKTTLLKLMGGIMVPSEGEVRRMGRAFSLLDVGTGFQEDLTGRENVFLNGALLGLSDGRLKYLMPEIEYYAELEGFMDTPLRYYSSGMRARLGFAVAMTADPEIFLIDEVLAVGDEGFRAKCYQRLDQLVASGTTIVIVSHDTEAVKRLCSRAVWLKGGSVHMDGAVQDVCSKYLISFYGGKRSEAGAVPGIAGPDGESLQGG